MAPDAERPAAPPPSPRRRRLGLAIAGLLLTALVALALVLAALARSDRGSAWLIGQLPGVTAQGVRGSLAGGAFEIARLQAQVAGRTLRVDGLAWRDLRWRWRPHPGAWLGLDVDTPSARRVEIGPATAPAAAPGPARAPQDLHLPLELQLRDLRVAVLQFESQAPLTELRASLHLGAEGGSVHRLDGLSLQWDRLQASGQARIAADAPLQVQATLALGARPGGADAWQAQLAVDGTLARLAARASLKDPVRRAALSAEATLTPFAPWPLAALQLSTRDLDLSALAGGAPSTALSGSAVVRSSGMDAPVEAELRLGNAQAGRWDQGRLPLRTLSLALRGQPRDRSRIEVERFVLELGDERGAAGELRGTGHWHGDAAQLDTRITGLRPARLDARLAAMTIGGPLNLSLAGLPSPDGRLAAAAQQRATVQATLDGRLDAAAATPVRLRVQAGARRDAGRIAFELREATASAGDARAAFTASGHRETAGAWQLKTRGQLSDFDPLPWYPGDEGSAWRQGPHRLNAHWQAELSGPAGPPAAASPPAGAANPPAGGEALLARLQALRGEATLELADSRLAGVPLSGRARLRAGEALALDAELNAAGNRLSVAGQAARQAGADRWHAELQAGALEALGPLLKLAALQAALPLGGQAEASVDLEGRWPALRTQGRLHASTLRAGALRLGDAQAQWSFSPQPDAPLSLTLDARGLAYGEQRADEVRLALDGTSRAHRATLQASSPLRPPAWVDGLVAASAPAGTAGPAGTPGAATWTGAPASAVPPSAPGSAVPPSAPGSAAPASTPVPAGTPGSTLSARIEGGWSGAESAWRGTLQELLARPRAGGAPWAVARELKAELRFTPEGALDAARVAPGRVELLGAALRWTEARWQRGGAAAAGSGSTARIDLDAELEPLRIAPLLARMQPQFGWGGDLTLGGRFVVRTSDSFAADLVLERRSGDLSRSDEGGSQALGLTDLRLALNAHDGQWYFTQAVAGRNVGVLSGAQALRVAPQLSWPPADTPLEGVLEWRVADLGAWAPWVPAGWRLGGNLRVSAGLGGRFGAPEYTGTAVGSELAVRNLLQGIDLRQGDLAITLRGADARIDRFRFKGGDGELALSGGASFGAAPRAQLHLAATRFQLLGRVDRRIVTSGEADLALAADSLKLDGRFKVDEGLIDFSRADAPSLDADVTVVGRSGPSPEGAQPPGGPAPVPPLLQKAEVALQVDLGDHLELRGRGIDTRLAGRLLITTPGGRLAVNGTVRTESGHYAAYGQKLDIERGVVSFTGPVENPRLDILAVRPNLDVRVGVIVGGTAQSPRVRLYSEPEMSDMDKLSWLVVGRAPEGLGRADTALLQRAALALITGERGGGTDTLLKNIGLDEFSLRQADSGDVRETVVAVGKQISRRWYVGYERGVNATTGSWQLIYRIAQRFTLRAQSGNENSLDVIWTWRWN